MPTKNHFTTGGQSYAQFRPEYPPALAQYLAETAANKTTAIDVGCGNGQLTTQLAKHFKTAIGIDPSQDQLKHATQAPNIEYIPGPAEKLPLGNTQANLITVAQAAHWFNLPEFYSEVRRIAAPDAVIALISYGLLTLEPEIDDLYQDFYSNQTLNFWPPERKLVDRNYVDLPFPFQEFQAPKMSIEKQMNFDEFVGYILTWSAAKKIKEEKREDILTNFFAQLEERWQKPDVKRLVTWPINMRIGRL